VSTVAVAPLGLTSVDRWTPRDVALGLGIAVLSSVLPYSLELVALRHLAQRVFGILLSLEPVVAALAGFVVLDQVLDRGQVVGMALVVLASVVVLGAQARPESPDAALGPG
jgi:inner membrane transporter RhtA